MKIAVVIRQLTDLIEPLEIDDSGKQLDLEFSRFLVNEYDDHALEQALLLKEQDGGSVTAVALDFGDVDQTLFAASAKGVDSIIKIDYDEDLPPSPHQLAKLYAEAIRPLEADLVMLGVQSFDELDGTVSALLSLELGLPYLGVLQNVEKGSDGSSVTVYKEYPGAAKAKMTVKLPAVLGILTASQPPRYVPISRIRSAMKTAQIEETEIAVADYAPMVQIQQLYPPEVGTGAEILKGSDEEIANRIIQILEEKGVIK
jgi:electron transfer flavoprotein beta subunit